MGVGDPLDWQSATMPFPKIRLFSTLSGFVAEAISIIVKACSKLTRVMLDNTDMQVSSFLLWSR